MPDSFAGAGSTVSPSRIRRTELFAGHAELAVDLFHGEAHHDGSARGRNVGILGGEQAVDQGRDLGIVQVIAQLDRGDARIDLGQALLEILVASVAEGAAPRSGRRRPSTIS